MALVASRWLGEFLVERKVLSRPKLEEMLQREEREGTSLARLLVSEHLVAEKDIVAAVAFQTGLHFVDLAITPVDLQAEEILAADVARKFVALPIKRDGGRLLVAMENPSDRAAVDALAEATGFEIDPGIAERRELRRAIDATYGRPPEGEVEISLVEGSFGGAARPLDEGAGDDLDVNELLQR